MRTDLAGGKMDLRSALQPYDQGCNKEEHSSCRRLTASRCVSRTRPRHLELPTARSSMVNKQIRTAARSCLGRCCAPDSFRRWVHSEDRIRKSRYWAAPNPQGADPGECR